MENPLHPFELHNYVELSLFGFDISINKAVLLMWVIIALVAGLLIAAGRSRRLVPTKLQSLAELLVDFIRGMILDTMGKKAQIFPVHRDAVSFHSIQQSPGTHSRIVHRDQSNYRHGRFRD